MNYRKFDDVDPKGSYVITKGRKLAFNEIDQRIPTDDVDEVYIRFTENKDGNYEGSHIISGYLINIIKPIRDVEYYDPKHGSDPKYVAVEFNTIMFTFIIPKLYIDYDCDHGYIEEVYFCESNHMLNCGEVIFDLDGYDDEIDIQSGSSYLDIGSFNIIGNDNSTSEVDTSDLLDALGSKDIAKMLKNGYISNTKMDWFRLRSFKFFTSYIKPICLYKNADKVTCREEYFAEIARSNMYVKGKSFNSGTMDDIFSLLNINPPSKDAFVNECFYVYKRLLKKYYGISNSSELYSLIDFDTMGIRD